MYTICKYIYIYIYTYVKMIRIYIYIQIIYKINIYIYNTLYIYIYIHTYHMYIYIYTSYYIYIADKKISHNDDICLPMAKIIDFIPPIPPRAARLLARTGHARPPGRPGGRRFRSPRRRLWAPGGWAMSLSTAIPCFICIFE